MPIDPADLVVLAPQQVLDADLPDWRFAFTSIETVFATPSYAAGLALVAAIGAAAESADHHPDVDLRYGTVGVVLSSHDVGGVTGRDVRLARIISGLAAEHGATAHPGRIQTLELALDTARIDLLRPFWAALYGVPLDAGRDDEVRDPSGRLPLIWFQRSEPTAPDEAPRQRWHLDLRVPPELVEERIAACLAAGGRLVDDSHARAFWVLADADGNQACLTTWQDRD